MKKLVNKIGQKIYSNKYVVAVSIFMTNVLMPELVRAGEAGGGYVTPINGLKTVLTTIAVAVGAVFVIYGGIRFAIAFQKMDQNGEHSAIYTLIAGGILLGISAVVTALS